MSVRVVLAVVVAAVLAALVAPAVQDAHGARDDAAATRVLDRLADASDRLVSRNAPGRTSATAPRRRVTLRVPDGATLRLRNRSRVVAVTSGDGPPARLALPAPVRLRNASIAVRGDAALVLRYELRDRPVIAVARDFIREPAATQ